VSRERVQRATRVVSVRARAVDVIELELSDLVRRSAQALEALDAARSSWQAALSAQPSSRCSSADLALAHSHRSALARWVSTRSAIEEKARLDEAACRKRLCAIKMDVKKLEIWRDGLLETTRANETLHEQRATDDMAARIARSA
jgi:flagellar biosynthesis chaperone FliJ